MKRTPLNKKSIKELRQEAIRLGEDEPSLKGLKKKDLICIITRRRLGLVK